jgi:hypothetical protein
MVYIIPKSNLLYCTTDKISTKQRSIIAENTINSLKVFIDNNLVTEVDVPNSVDISVWNDKILETVSTSEAVIHALSGKIQTKVEYWPGELYIETTQTQVDSPRSNIQNTFSMNSGSPVTNYLNPSQMIDRLNNVIKKG